MQSNSTKRSLCSCLDGKTGGGAKDGSLSWTSCQEGMVWVEKQRMYEKSAFQGGQLKVQKVRKTACEVFYTTPHYAGLIAASLLVLSFQAGVGPSVLNDRSEPLTFGMLQVLFVTLPSN